MNTDTPAAPSTFVTVLAWILIVIYGFSVLMAILQNVMINVIMPTMGNMHTDGRGPGFPLGIFRALGAVSLLTTAFLTYTAYALLKRRNWARRTLIVVFAIGIAWSALMILMMTLGVGFGALPNAGAPHMGGEVRTMMSVIFAVMAVFMAVLAVLGGWLIYRLRSASIRAEFA